IAKGAESDLNVIVQIGERGREVRPFIEDCLGPKGLARSIVVVSTSDETPLMRVRAAETSVAIADYFRGKGANVLFLMDSLTRLATAQREIGLLLGEPPSARGYTPSVFQLLSNVLERLGMSAEGSITGVLTVLVDGNDMDEPVSDAVRAMLDGHIILDRQIAEKGHFPAISVPHSLSRVIRDVTDSEHQTAAQKLRNILATHAEVDVLIRVGAYAKGNSAQVDRAVALMPALQMFLRQAIETYSPFDETRQAMAQIAAAWPY
ncbi:MAG: EscN/YscN/HrcN family type III secretion system ATPase, partial [Planctomycetaceae bacterium]